MWVSTQCQCHVEWRLCSLPSTLTTTCSAPTMPSTMTTTIVNKWLQEPSSILGWQQMLSTPPLMQDDRCPPPISMNGKWCPQPQPTSVDNRQQPHPQMLTRAHPASTNGYKHSQHHARQWVPTTTINKWQWAPTTTTNKWGLGTMYNECEYSSPIPFIYYWHWNQVPRRRKRRCGNQMMNDDIGFHFINSDVATEQWTTTSVVVVGSSSFTYVCR